jgi:hypothetical protein
MATKKTASASASVKRINAKIDAINRKSNPADRWYVFDASGKLLVGDLFYKTARGALMRAIPGAHIYSYGMSGNQTYSFAIDKEPRHVFVTRDPDFDLRMRKTVRNPARVGVTRAKEPKHQTKMFEVWDAERNQGIAQFFSKEKAVEYAKAYANKWNVPVKVIRED